MVTGHDERGRSVFVSDAAVTGDRFDLFPGWEFHALWGVDEPPCVPHDAPPDQVMSTYFPGTGGFRFSLSTIPPEGTPAPDDIDLIRAQAAVEAGMPGLLAHMEADDPGMHTTDTVDLEIILSGEVILELDESETRLLRPGDTVVQTGTRHRWRNPGPAPCVMAVFMIGAQRRDG